LKLKFLLETEHSALDTKVTVPLPLPPEVVSDVDVPKVWSRSEFEINSGSWSTLVIVIDLVNEVAAAYVRSPLCLAVTEQVPAELIVKVVLETVHTEVGLDVKVTDNPLEAVALKV
jgi:hypothetical protein